MPKIIPFYMMLSLIILSGDLEATCEKNVDCPAGETCYLGNCVMQKLENEVRPYHKEFPPPIHNSSIHESPNEKKK